MAPLFALLDLDADQLGALAITQGDPAARVGVLVLEIHLEKLRVLDERLSAAVEVIERKPVACVSSRR